MMDQDRDERDFGLKTETETRVVSRLVSSFETTCKKVSVSVSKFETDFKSISISLKF